MCGIVDDVFCLEFGISLALESEREFYLKSHMNFA